jgi:hypothetical protein
MKIHATPAELCLRDAFAQMPYFIAAVLDRGVQQLALRAMLVPEVERAGSIRAAGAMLSRISRPVEHAFMRQLGSRLEGGGAPAAGRYGKEQLDLCLDDGLDGDLDVEHLYAAAELECAPQRIEFEGLLSGACDSHIVAKDSNPLRPEVHARCLVDALGHWPVPQAVREAWFNGLGVPLGLELAQLYGALSKQLRNAGVREAGYLPPMVAGRHFVSWGARA